jgi:hypothetical protein
MERGQRENHGGKGREDKERSIGGKGESREGEREFFARFLEVLGLCVCHGLTHPLNMMCPYTLMHLTQVISTYPLHQ